MPGWGALLTTYHDALGVYRDGIGIIRRVGELGQRFLLLCGFGAAVERQDQRDWSLAVVGGRQVKQVASLQMSTLDGDVGRSSDRRTRGQRFFASGGSLIVGSGRRRRYQQPKVDNVM